MSTTSPPSRTPRSPARSFSGIQPTGELHLGNYLGAVRRWVDEQDTHDAVYCVVDLHAMTLPYDPAELAGRTRATATLLMAAGLDPERCVLFAQSHVREHTELTWMLNCVATVGELRRMTQFKEKGQGRDSAGAGVFDYPVLMAADILLHDTDEVPVGDDQRQHVELTRDLALRFNHHFGETLVVPRATFPGVGARVMDLQDPTAKMSKSSVSPQGTILLVDEPAAITRKVRAAVTDSGREVRHDVAAKPGVSNLLEIMSACTGRSLDTLADELAAGGYGALKAAVADAIVEALRPVQERYRLLAADPAEVDRLLGRGAARARARAAATMDRARAATGLLPPLGP